MSTEIISHRRASSDKKPNTFKSAVRHIDTRAINKVISRGLLVGAFALVATASGKAIVSGANNEKSAEKGIIPHGSLQITFDDGSKLICPDPKYIKENGYVPGLLMAPPGSALTTLPYLCDPGEQDLLSLLPRHTIKDMEVVAYDGSVIKVECPTGMVDLSDPKCVSINQAK